MYQAIPVDIRTSARHGGFVLLENFHFEQGELQVRVFAPGTGDEAQLTFSDVVGFAMREDLFGPPFRPEGSEETRPRDEGFFHAASDESMAETTRAAPQMGAHKQFRLSLREHELTFVAGPDYQIKVEAKRPAS